MLTKEQCYCILVNLYGQVTYKMMLLLKSLAVFKKILHLKEFNRTSRNISKLHNPCYMHFGLLREIIGFNLVKDTREKLYGKYSHNLLELAPLQS